MRQAVILKCQNPKCRKKFKKLKAEHHRCQLAGLKHFCSLKCAHKAKIHGYTKRKCKHCGKRFTTRNVKATSLFCSLRCAKTFAGKFTNRDNVSKGMLLAHKEGRAFKHTKVIRTKSCCICNKPFVLLRNITRKTCSDTCYRALISRNSRNNPNCGGETNFKHYKYKKITMDSSWEVNLAKWLDARHIRWRRSRSILFHYAHPEKGKSRYHPDFFLPDLNVYVDPKNKYRQLLERHKMEAVIRENHITLFWGDLDPIKARILECWEYRKYSGNGQA